METMKPICIRCHQTIHDTDYRATRIGDRHIICPTPNNPHRPPIGEANPPKSENNPT